MVQRRLVGLVRIAPGRVALTFAFALSAAACSIGQGLATGLMVRRVLEGAAVGDLGAYALAIGLLVAGRAALLWARDVTAHWAAATIKARLRHQLYDRLLELGPGYTLTQRTGAVQATVVDGVEALQAYVGFYLPQAAVAMVAPLTLGGFLVALDPVVGLIVLACTAIVPLSRPLWSRLLGERGKKHWDAYEHLAARMLDALQGITTLKMLGAGRRRGDQLQEDSAELYRATVANLRASLGVYTVTATVFGVGTAMAAAVGGLRFAGGSIGMGELLLVLFLANECFRPLTELQNYWHEGFYGMAASGGIFALLDAEPAVRDPEHPAAVPDLEEAQSVELRELTFRYPTGDRPALDGVDVHVPAGKTLAVVGRSGAGKSTIVHLLLRAFDPDAGSVAIGGVDLRDLRIDDTRRLTAVVSQDVYLFCASVRDNLLVARPDATDEELWAAARAAGADSFVAALPDGWDTIVGERGARLSGGERQRLAIARALLKDAPVLILDEATSSVDGANEAAIQAAIDRLTVGRTVVVIAHRLSTVAAADQVVVLDEGRVVEAGPGRELLAAGGAYAELTAAQVSA
jgi:ATP-binding cassette, subfamily C, bacterial CydD